MELVPLFNIGDRAPADVKVATSGHGASRYLVEDAAMNEAVRGSCFLYPADGPLGSPQERRG